MAVGRKRKQLRLKEYDYSQAGAYFVTICTKNRTGLFGETSDAEMGLNPEGQIVEECWKVLPSHYPGIELDEFVVMPNHLHGIILIHDVDDAAGAMSRRPNDRRSSVVGAIHESPLRETIIQRRKMLLPKIIGRFKMNSAKRINAMRNTPGQPVWQGNYFEHIVRTERSLNRIRQYISNNAAQWQYDRENPSRKATDEFDTWLESQGRIALQRKGNKR